MKKPKSKKKPTKKPKVTLDNFNAAGMLGNVPSIGTVVNAMLLEPQKALQAWLTGVGEDPTGVLASMVPRSGPLRVVIDEEKGLIAWAPMERMAALISVVKNMGDLYDTAVMDIVPPGQNVAEFVKNAVESMKKTREMNQPPPPEGEHGERCMRCGEVDEDRRTLKMACFYAMDEMPIPFEQIVLFRTALDKLEKAKDPVGFATPSGQKINLIAGTVRTSEELHPENLYTLRVCKDCRADWMAAIEAWFKNVKKAEPVGSGIFIRRNGINVEISREEWDRLQAEKAADTA